MTELESIGQQPVHSSCALIYDLKIKKKTFGPKNSFVTQPMNRTAKEKN